MPSNGVFAARLASVAPRTVHTPSGSTRVRLAGSPTAIGRPWSASRPICAGRSDSTRATPRQSSSPGSTMVCTSTDSAVCSPSMPGPGRGPLGVLVLRGVRGVVGGHHVDHALGQRGPHGLGVLAGAQRRVDLVDRVVAGQRGVGEQQVVRGDLGGDPHPGRLGRPQHVDGARRRRRGRRAARRRPRGPARSPGPRSSPRRWPASRPARAGTATTPSCACAPAVSRWSSACWAITTSSAVAYSRARRMISGSCTQRPSSENIRTPARAIVPSSAILHARRARR